MKLLIKIVGVFMIILALVSLVVGVLAFFYNWGHEQRMGVVCGIYLFVTGYLLVKLKKWGLVLLSLPSLYYLTIISMACLNLRKFEMILTLPMAVLMLTLLLCFIGWRKTA